ncbi:MAG TPA: polymer-forming cytoskeletal protein [Bacteroidales bacterium]|nr:polymer-forming cytoskeletal protein [Bacteroidales bacterium]HPS16663.1 polymer-forming cytoskeletal protein [Bacteroidales bacterium]
MAKLYEQESPAINLIGAGTVIKGDVKSNGDIRIDGTLIGSVNSKGKLVVGTSGNIDGEIICQNADLSGIIKAQITVSELLSIKATAKITGDVITNKLAIEPGAIFSGSCSMNNPQTNPIKETKFGERVEPLKPNEPQKTKEHAS